MITKVGTKLLSDLVVPLDFDDSIRVVPLKYLMYFLVGINTK